MKRENAQGFTLIEVMLAMAVFAMSMAAFAGLYLTTMRLNESSRNLTQAMNHARVALEAMRDTAQSGGLTGAGGVTTVYSTGVNLLGSGQPFAGLGTLTGESIKVSYTNPAADPLPVTLNVNWEQNGHTRDPIKVETMITRR